MGIIHKNMTPEQQAQEVRRVKKTESGMVVEPVTITPESTLRQALALMHAYGFSGLPVVSGGKPVGILTSRDLRFETNLDQPVGGVMTRDPIAVRQGIALEDARRLLHKHRIEKLLVVDAKGELLGLITVKDILNASRTRTRSRTAPGACAWARRSGSARTCRPRVAALVAEHVDVIVLDTAHGHSKGVLDYRCGVRSELPELQIIAGNVATARGLRGAVRGRCGRGQGRHRSGVDLHDAGGGGRGCAADLGDPRVRRGGPQARGADHRRRRDQVLGRRRQGARGGGRLTVMVGSLFAGTDEAPGELVLYQGRSYKVYRGMGSLGAMKAGSTRPLLPGRGQRRAQAGAGGHRGRVPHRGPLADSLYQIVGGLRSGMGYCGARTLVELRETAELRRMTSAGAAREPRARRDHHQGSAELPGGVGARAHDASDPHRLDFGSQVTQLIARRMRELGVYAEILPYHTPIGALAARDRRALILSGGPSSLLRAEGAPQLDPEVLELGVPVLGICYGLYLLIGGARRRRDRGERSASTGRAACRWTRARARWRALPPGVAAGVDVARRSGRAALPPGFTARWATRRIVNLRRCGTRSVKLWGVQFHPEVTHSERGQEVLVGVPRRGGFSRRLDHGGVHRRGGGEDPARVGASGRCCAGCRAASTRRSRRCWSSARSARGCTASSSTTGCCERTSGPRWSGCSPGGWRSRW
jgi:IMP dehydrogenase